MLNIGRFFWCALPGALTWGGSPLLARQGEGLAEARVFRATGNLEEAEGKALV